MRTPRKCATTRGPQCGTPLAPLRSLMEWAVVLFPVLSAAAGYLLDGVHVQDIARAFAK